MTVLTRVFERNSTYLIRADGGMEVEYMSKVLGLKTFLLTVQDTDEIDDGKINVHGKDYKTWTLDSWVDVIAEIDKQPDCVYVPWGFESRDEQCDILVTLGKQAYEEQKTKLARPTLVHNAEKYADPQYVNPQGVKGETVHVDHMVAVSKGCDVMWSTTPWAFEGLAPGQRKPDGTERPGYDDVPASWTLDPQFFPFENMSSHDPRSCIARFHEFGFPGRVQKQIGRHGCTPDDFSFLASGWMSLYAGDDVKSSGTVWKPQVLVPLTAAEFPYAGPFYGPSSGRPVTRHPGVIDLKWALHHAGYWTIKTRPDKAMNRPTEAALARAQRDYGIKPTGQYGLKSWNMLLGLASVVPGETHAVAT